MFTPEQIKYIKTRSTRAKNPLLKSRYNHILFKITKNRNYGIRALEAYKSISKVKSQDALNFNTITAIQAIIKLTQTIKFEREKIKKELLHLVKTEKGNLYQRYRIVTLLIDSELYKSHEFKFFPKLALVWISHTNEDDYTLRKGMLEYAIKICINNGIDTSIYFEELANNELSLLKQHPEDSDFVRTHILGDIVEYYSRAKNIDKYNEYLKEYTRSKSNIELKAFDISPDEESQKALNENLNRHVEIILSWDLDKILIHYSSHSRLFPDIDEITNSSNKNFKNSFLQFSTTSTFDINNNVKQLSDAENIQRNIHLSYEYSFGVGVLAEFIRVMQVGAYNRKISYFNVYEYLSTRSWFGQNIVESKMRTKESFPTYTWLNLMAPALHSFLIQLETSFLVNKRLTYTNWILPIDSLTLKFEGALREFIKIIGGNTSVLKKNQLQEMILEDLLNCETAKKVFSVHDLALFRMILTKNGDNIRHNVAHGFYHPSDYNLETACKIFLCILRLSAYKLDYPQENK